MTNQARSHAILLGATLTIFGIHVQTAAANDQIHVMVRVENAAGVPTGILASAQDDARRVFRAAGIDVVWLTGKAAGSDDRIIRVVLPTLTGSDQYLRMEHVDAFALGAANARAGLVHIFWDRLNTFAAQFGRDEAGVLGQVLAHEIGHVLLPGAGHSSTGIMQAKLELRMMAALRFTPQQSEQMRSYLGRAPEVAAEGTDAIRLR